MVLPRAERLRHWVSQEQCSVAWGIPLRPSSVAKSKRGQKVNVQEAYAFTSKERLAVRSAVTDTGPPQSALPGMAVTQQLEIIFDTVKSSRNIPT